MNTVTITLGKGSTHVYPAITVTSRVVATMDQNGENDRKTIPVINTADKKRFIPAWLSKENFIIWEENYTASLRHAFINECDGKVKIMEMEGEHKLLDVLCAITTECGCLPPVSITGDKVVTYKVTTAGLFEIFNKNKGYRHLSQKKFEALKTDEIEGAYKDALMIKFALSENCFRQVKRYLPFPGNVISKGSGRVSFFGEPTMVVTIQPNKVFRIGFENESNDRFYTWDGSRMIRQGT